ncbi:MAG: DUF2341 domain-containing protein [Chitinophagales bacterium]|nr:DUF2341 domain-containing protein [Chitinophagales bacterium]
MKRFTLLSMLVTMSIFLYAQDCVSDWSYYLSITIDNADGESLTDYQVSFTLNTAEWVAAGKLQADGADLRVFTDDCTPLPFWGDSLGISSQTRIWVKVPAINAGASLNLQVYYGNPDAESVIDGENTFILFDDFEGTEVDTDKWEAVGEYATFEVNDGRLRYSSTSMNPGPRFKFVRSKANFAEDVTFDFVIERTNADGYGFSSSEEPISRFIIRDSGFGFDTLNQIAIMLDTISNGTATQLTYPLLRFDRHEFNTVSITPHINDQNEFVFTRFANEGLGDENTDTLIVQNINMPGFHFIMSSFSPSFIIEMENIRVRQHTTNPPSSFVGEEQMLTPSSLDQIIAPTLLQVFPNPTQDIVYIKSDWKESIFIQIYDIQGRIIPNINVLLLPKSEQTINLSQLSSGVYFLQFRSVSNGTLLHSQKLNILR